LYIDNTSPEALISYGDMYLEAGAVSDALDFYAKAKHHSGMEKIKDIAMKSGDFMQFQRAAKTLNIEPKPADWERIGRKAIESKKYFFARHALEKTNNEELLNSLKTKMNTEGHE
jgi:hypothetical protein